MTIKIKENKDGWTIEEKLYMPDMNGQVGIDLFNEADVQWVKWNEPADIGVCKNGDGCTGMPLSKCILLAFEPPSQISHMYDDEYRSRFGAGGIFATKMTPAHDHFYIPRSFNHVDKFFQEQDRSLLCFIGNDFHSNFHKEKDLMVLRRNLIRFFAGKFGPTNFHCVGIPAGPCTTIVSGLRDNGLNGYGLKCSVTEGRTVGYDGKFDFLSKHTFTLALENAAWPGYYGIKAIEAMQCGSIPLYVGDTEIDSHTPKDVYIDMRGKSAEELYSIITLMSKEEIDGYRNRIYKYMKGSGNEIFSSVTFAKKLLHYIRRPK